MNYWTASHKFDKKLNCVFTGIKTQTKATWRTTPRKDCAWLNAAMLSGVNWSQWGLCTRLSYRLYSLFIYFCVAAHKKTSHLRRRTRSVAQQPPVLTDSSKERRFKIRPSVHTRTLIYCCFKKINFSESLDHKLFSVVI